MIVICQFSPTQEIKIGNNGHLIRKVEFKKETEKNGFVGPGLIFRLINNKGNDVNVPVIFKNEVMAFYALSLVKEAMKVPFFDSNTVILNYYRYFCPDKVVLSEVEKIRIVQSYPVQSFVYKRLELLSRIRPITSMAQTLRYIYELFETDTRKLIKALEGPLSNNLIASLMFYIGAPEDFLPEVYWMAVQEYYLNLRSMYDEKV